MSHEILPSSEARLYAIVLRLVALHPGALPANHGDQARAALLDLVKRGDAALATYVHNLNAEKPYTVSQVLGGQRGRDGALHFGAGHEAFWRFTLLGEPVFEAILQRYLRDNQQPHVRLGTLPFAITDAFATAARHADSGSITLADLQARWHVPPETLPDTFILDFQTPTAFSLGTLPDGQRRFQALPDARLVLSTLRKRWSRLGGQEPGDVFDEWVAQNITVEPLHLQTQRVQIERQSLTGFTGQVCYRVQGNRRWWSLAHLLAELTFWTGVGYQTPRGLGQTRRLPLEPGRSD